MRLNLVLLHSQLRSELFAVDSVKPGYKLLYSVQHAVKAFGKDGDFGALRALVAAHLHISLVYLIGSVGQRRERGKGALGDASGLDHGHSKANEQRGKHGYCGNTAAFVKLQRRNQQYQLGVERFDDFSLAKPQVPVKPVQHPVVI